MTPFDTTLRVISNNRYSFHSNQVFPSGDSHDPLCSRLLMLVLPPPLRRMRPPFNPAPTPRSLPWALPRLQRPPPGRTIKPYRPLSYSITTHSPSSRTAPSFRNITRLSNSLSVKSKFGFGGETLSWFVILLPLRTRARADRPERSVMMKVLGGFNCAYVSSLYSSLSLSKEEFRPAEFLGEFYIVDVQQG